MIHIKNGTASSQGMALYALAALDIAFWDAFSKAAERPFASFLGGSINNPIKAYNSSGLWLIDLDNLAKEAEELRKEGDFKAIKLRIGREKYKEDIEALKNVRNGAGSDIIVMLLGKPVIFFCIVQVLSQPLI